MGSGSDSGVAVLIAAYNAEVTIARSVASALAQPEVIEVCVIDDLSEDGTVAAALACDDGTGRLKVLRQQSNQGPGAARNRGIDESRAPFLCVLDADDYLLAGRTASLLAHRHDAELVCDDLLRVFEGAEHERPDPVWDIGAVATISFETFVDRNVPRAGSPRQELGFLKPLIRRSFLDAHGLRYSDKLRLGEDFELYARALALGGRMLITPAAGYVAVMSAASLSGRHTERDLVALRDASARLRDLRRMSFGERRAVGRYTNNLDCKVAWLRLIDAVKARDFRCMAATFLKPGPVPGYLAARLAEQVVERTFLRRLKAAS